MNIEGSLPTKKYLQLFALWIENSKKEQAIDLANQGFVPRIIKMFVLGKTSLKQDSAAAKWKRACYDSTIRFRVNYRLLDRGTLFLDKPGIIAINKLLYDLFLEVLVQRMEFQKRIGIDYKKTIFDFCEEVGIEIEQHISYEALRKATFRLKTAKKKPVLMGNPVLN
jgi:hypothetical protein